MSCSSDLEYNPWYLRNKYTEDGWYSDIIIRNVKDLNKNFRIDHNFFRIRSLAVLDRNRFVGHYYDAFGTTSYVSIFKSNGELLKRFHKTRIGALIECIVVLPDKTIAIGKNDDQIELWNGEYESWKWPYNGFIRSLKGHKGTVKCLAVLNDGFRLASGSRDCKIKIWNTRNGILLRPIEEHDYVYSLAALKDGSLASGCADSKIKIWNPNNGKLIQILEGHAAAVRSLVVLNDRRIASGSDDATLKIWKPESNFEIGVDTSLAYTNSGTKKNGFLFHF